MITINVAKIYTLKTYFYCRMSCIEDKSTKLVQKTRPNSKTLQYVKIIKYVIIDSRRSIT